MDWFNDPNVGKRTSWEKFGHRPKGWEVSECEILCCRCNLVVGHRMRNAVHGVMKFYRVTRNGPQIVCSWRCGQSMKAAQRRAKKAS